MGGRMSQELPILLGTEEEAYYFWRSYRCCWNCFLKEMSGRGYDIEVTDEWLDPEEVG
jgi:hypothetical protein